MSHDVFVSYPSENKPVADAVCATLEARKVRCWIAPRDVQPGRSYADEIASAIDSSRVVVLVFSGHSNRSPHVMREVEMAINRGLPVLPLRIENVVPAGGLGYYLKTIHWLDAMTPPFEAHLEHLAATVLPLLGGTPPLAEPVTRESPPSVPTARGRRWSAATVAWIAGFMLLGLLTVGWYWAGDGASTGRDAPNVAGAATARSLPADLEKLQGFWTMVASEQKGQRQSMAVGDFEVEFDGDTMWTYERPHPRTGGTLIFREDSNPRGFDEVFTYERDGKAFQGRITWIYRFLDGDHLEMAYPSDDSFDRPSAYVPRGFDSTAEAIDVVTFVRKQ